MRNRLAPIFLLLIISGAGFAHGIPGDRRKHNQQVERIVAADARVTVSVCTLSGNFTVRGWDRKQVRARVNDAVDIELTRVNQNQSQPATELKLTSKGRRSSDCLMSADVELDVPRDGGVRIQTTNGDISVTGVATVNAVTTSGSMTIRDVRGETKATTIGGELSVRDSSGSFRLNSTGGSIDARDLKPVLAADAILASTVSGEVLLTHVQHQHLSVSSVSGEIAYTGPLIRNGSYHLSSLSGEVRLAIPANSSFRLLATVGAGVKIHSDFDLKYSENQNMTGEGNRGAPRRVSATVRTGDSAIKISILTGSLRIVTQ